MKTFMSIKKSLTSRALVAAGISCLIIFGMVYTASGTTIGGNVTTASVYATGSTGVGTTSPATLLEVQSQATSTLTITTASSTPQDPVLSFRTGANPSENFKLYVDDSDTNKLVIATSTSGSLLTIDQGGLVGIATSTPASLLSVGTTTGSQFLVNTTGVISGGATWNGAAVGAGYGGTGLASATAGYTIIGSSATALQATSSLYVSTAGNVGVGTSTPVSLLSVGTTTGSQFLVNTTGVISGGAAWNGAVIGDTYINDALTISGGTINNTAIGATTPLTAVFTNATSTNSTSTGWLYGAIITDGTFKTTAGTITGATWNGGAVGVGYGGTGLASATAGYTIIGSSATALQATSSLFISPASFVGIGTSTPATVLHVSSDSATTTVTIGDAGSGKGGCIKLRDSADGAWVYCVAVGGNISCTANSCE